MAAPAPAEVHLALRLRRLREDARLTQSQLAAIFSTENKVGAASISSWENLRRPAALPESRLEPYARLFAIPPGPGDAYLLVPEGALTNDQVASRDTLHRELRGLWEDARGGPAMSEAARISTYRSWFFDDEGPAVIVAPDIPATAQGPLANPADPNYTELYGFADLDALIELHGHIRAENEPTFQVTFKRASTVEVDDLSGHLVLLGGIAWNDLTRHLLRLLTRLPVRQMEVPGLETGEVFAVGHGADERRFEPQWSPVNPGELDADVGLLARLTNPYNSSRTLTICNGVHSRGVLGAVRALTDARIRDANESYLAERFPKGEFAVLMRVPVVMGKAVSPDLRNPDSILYEWPQREAVSPRGPGAR
jgi:transcriptional regulator with XRE-family HTH domain